MKTVFLPRAQKGQEADIFVGVNGQGWRIQRGVEGLVDDAVAEVLANARAAQEKNDAFLQENSQD